MLPKLHRRRSNNWTMVSFIHNGSEITTQLGWGIPSKPKPQNPKQSNIFKKRTSFLNFKAQILRLARKHWSCTSSHQDSYFYSYTYEKTYLAVHFIKECFCQFVDRKIVDLMPKYYLVDGDTSQVYFFLT